MSGEWSERRVIDLLVARYSVRGGNGPRWAYASHVKSAPGFDAPRCMDFCAMSLWPSDGLALHGHEVKVSRSDWLAELRQPDKADTFRRYMDRWWLVVSDRSVVRNDLPDGWGLMVASASGVRVVKQAPPLEPDPLPRSLVATLLRATSKTSARYALTPTERHP